MRTVVVEATFSDGESMTEYAIEESGRIYPFGSEPRADLCELTRRIASRDSATEYETFYNTNSTTYRILHEVTL